jgi:hypothetical protein
MYTSVLFWTFGSADVWWVLMLFTLANGQLVSWQLHHELSWPVHQLPHTGKQRLGKHNNAPNLTGAQNRKDSHEQHVNFIFIYGK